MHGTVSLKFAVNKYTKKVFLVYKFSSSRYTNLIGTGNFCDGVGQ